MSEIDIAGAQEAYNAATQQATPTTQGNEGLERNELGQWTPRETPAPPAEAPAVDAQQEAPATPEGTDEAPFTHIDPNVLPPEMQQLYRSLQADYTRKTQEAAPWRKLGSEFGVESPDDFREALSAYQTLQDPRNWPTIHQELAGYMQQYGMSPQEANLAASNQLAQMAPSEEEADYDTGYVDDESIAPLARQLKQTQAELAAMRNEWQTQQQKQAEELQWNTLAQGLTQAEMQIRAQNPHYTDQDIETIYNMIGQDGNLVSAQQRYESVIGARLAQYISSKQTTQTQHPGVVPGAGVHSQQEQRQPKDLNEAYQMALADITAQENAAQ